MRERPGFWSSLGRSQIASFIATACDNGIYFLLNEVFGVWYALATAIGAFCGAAIHFTFGRYWAFIAVESSIHGQAFRYALVALGSLLLNTGLVLLFTENGLYKHASKIVAALLVGFLYNYPLHRYFVFRK